MSINPPTEWRPKVPFRNLPKKIIEVFPTLVASLQYDNAVLMCGLAYVPLPNAATTLYDGSNPDTIILLAAVNVVP